MMMALVAATAMLAACGSSERERRAEMERRAAASGFHPPAVTSRLDFGGMMERRFRALDRNADDVITPDEMPRKDSRLIALDRNRDGRVTSTEFSEGMLRRFDAMDLNRDGTVTSDEERDWRASQRGGTATGVAPTPTATTAGPVLPGG